jgi:hypothetical protein
MGTCHVELHGIRDLSRVFFQGSTEDFALFRFYARIVPLFVRLFLIFEVKVVPLAFKVLYGAL